MQVHYQMHGHPGQVCGRLGSRWGSRSPHKNGPVVGPPLPITTAERPWPREKKCLRLIGVNSELPKLCPFKPTLRTTPSPQHFLAFPPGLIVVNQQPVSPPDTGPICSGSRLWFRLPVDSPWLTLLLPRLRRPPGPPRQMRPSTKRTTPRPTRSSTRPWTNWYVMLQPHQLSSLPWLCRWKPVATRSGMRDGPRTGSCN